MTKQKLELTWIGKEKRPQLEPRILLEDPARSYHAKQRFSDADIFDNRLIFGDNLLALKALEQEFAGKVKCVFIDPPYNTGSAFTHYDDGVEHSIWLGLIRDRLEIIRRLLADDGSLWITIDDNEAHYLKVICDEIFGRSNFLCDISWEKRYSPPPDTKDFGYVHDHILVYRKGPNFRRNLLPLTEDQSGRYKNPDKDSRGPWKAMDYTCRYSADERPNLFYPITQPNTGEEIWPKRTRVWAMSREVHQKNEKEKRIWWGAKGTNSVPAMKNFFSEINQGMMPMSLWKHTLAGHNQEAAKEMLGLYGDDVFSTPKPERLLQTALHVATRPGDLVLDSFAGSGTTGAVAHKMGRRWIMVELGDHCHTHIIPRLQKVIDGQDPGGVSEATGWKGGGGFRYYSLAPSLIVNDRWGNPVINPEYNPAQLSEALCKLEAFTYAPSETRWWQHGHSSERDFIYVTTQNLSADQLQALADEVGEEQSLLVCCAAYHGVTAAKAAERWPNLTLKKIPKMVLSRCEWGHDDYSLNVANLPMAQETPEAEPVTKAKKTKKAATPQPGLFEGEEE
jgi:adenine-specific DNA-methyltransferase